MATRSFLYNHMFTKVHFPWHKTAANKKQICSSMYFLMFRLK